MLDPFPPGVRVTRAGLNNLPRHILGMIRPGPGIRMMPSGDGGFSLSTELPRTRGGAASPAAGLQRARVIELHEDGDAIACYLWQGDDWSQETTLVLKPDEMQVSVFDDQTLTYTDDTPAQYATVVDFDKRFERRVIWEGGARSEVQAITAPYRVGETLWVFQDSDLVWHDYNQAGRHWAEKVEEEIGT